MPSGHTEKQNLTHYRARLLALLPVDEAERQLLEYLSMQPRGRALICVPDLVAAARRLALDPSRLITDVYEGPEGCVIAMISQAGITALSGTR